MPLKARGIKALPPTNIPRLPPDILSYIFAILLDVDPTSLARCCRVSRSVSEVASPMLYRKIRVSPYALLDSRADYSTDRLTATGREKTNTRKKQLLKNAEVVTFDHHHASWCGTTKFKYPKLETLVLNLSIGGLGPVLHSNDILEKQCSLVKGLQPKKLVINVASFLDICIDSLGVPSRIYDGIESLTYVCPLNPVEPVRCYGGFGEMPKLKKITWIFHTSQPAIHWKLGTMGVFGPDGTGQLNVMDFNSLAGMVMQWPKVPIVIVNSGGLHPVSFGLTQWDETSTQARFKQELKDAMEFELEGQLHRDQNRGDNNTNERSDSEKANRRFANIQFISMRDYLENNDWTGVISPQVAAAWLK